MSKVALDIESMVGDKLYPYQVDMINKIAGFKAGEMSIISAGRQTGKSYFADMYNTVFKLPAYKKMSIAKVDDAEWVTVQCNREIAAWVREQNTKYWYEHNSNSFGSSFDLHSKLYTMLKLTFTP